MSDWLSMWKEAVYLLVLLLVSRCTSSSKSPGWTLLLGDGVGNQHSKVQSTTQYPGSRANMAFWQDKKKYVWMFGGFGFDENPPDQGESLGDLWQLDTLTLQWKLINDGKELGKKVASKRAVKKAAGEKSEGEKARAGKNSWPRFQPQPRQGSALCGVTDTMLLLFGGINNNKQLLFDTWIFDIPQSTWIPLFAKYANKSEKPSHPTARFDMAQWCSESRLIIYGGRGAHGKDLDDLWTFSIPNLQWKKQRQFVQMDKIPAGAPSQPFPVARHGAITWRYNDVLYLLGGSEHNKTDLQDVWSFTLNTSMWMFNSEDKSQNPGSHSLIWPSETPGDVLVFGGCLQGTRSISPLPDFAKFQLSTKSWQNLDFNSSYTLESLNEISSTFINLPQKPNARCQALTWNRNGQHFLFGGFGLDRMNRISYLNDIYVLVDSQASLTALFEVKNLTSPKGSSLQLSAQRIFFICFASFGGVVLVFGAGFFFKKMVDFPRHHPTRSYNVKYSPLSDEAMFDM